MIEIHTTSQQVDLAKQKADDMGLVNNSILKSKGNITGFLGEVVVHDFLSKRKSNVHLTNTYDYDIVYDNKIRIDVKSKYCTSPPQDYYECTVYNPNQECDTYVFTRVLKDLSTVWILGYINKEEYYNKATPLKEGDIDPSNNYRVIADCYNLSIKDLHKF